MGTSLKVHPFAMLPALVPHECPRLLLNLEPAGGIGAHSNGVGHLTNKEEAVNNGDEYEEDEYGTEEEEDAQPAWVNDVVHLGPCDKSVRELCDLLGWRAELEAVWKELGGDGSGADNDQSAAPAANVGRNANSNGTANVTADGDDHNAVNDEGKGKSIGSEKQSQHDQSESRTTPALEGGGDLAGGEDNSVEKTLGLIIQDMKETLKLSAKEDGNADEHSDHSRAPDSNA